MSKIIAEPHEIIDPASTRGLELKNGVWAAPSARLDGWIRVPVSYDISWTPLDCISPLTMLFSSKPALPPPPLPVRKQVGGIVAYRGWRVNKKDGLRLQSVGMDTYWDGPVLVADEPPDDRGGHGIYAFAKPSANDVMEYPVWGEVMLYGRVVVHKHGYRAERAMIRRLVVSPAAWVSYPGIEDALTTRYGCEVSTDFRSILQQTGERTGACELDEDDDDSDSEDSDGDDR